MDKIEFSTGGFPLSTDRLADMQQCWQFIAELAKAWGNNAVIHGCSGWASGGAVSDGLIVFNGELLPFRSGGQGNRVQVIEQKHPITYSDGSQRTFRTTRYATATTSSATGTLPQSIFAQASQIPQLATAALLNQKVAALNQKDTELSQKIAANTRTINQLTGNQQQTNNEVDSLNRWLVPAGTIVMWGARISQIPKGWHLCDGTHGTPNLLNRFVICAGDEYIAGDAGGQDFIKLDEGNLPPHSHKLGIGLKKWDNGWKGENSTPWQICQGNITETESAGYGLPFDNRSRWFSLAYIMKLYE